eukprot:TRINITY_DN29613_c0_g1_i1.p1 TRINITY_DN29613_c0_g1~~TRINITY_DN29613_c0_g1_i1.p1  ORF type:complete len:654 (-),score=76.83 TRINITY_DN29613_c0_g1_i1:60-2021(-)
MRANEAPLLPRISEESTPRSATANLSANPDEELGKTKSGGLRRGGSLRKSVTLALERAYTLEQRVERNIRFAAGKVYDAEQSWPVQARFLLYLMMILVVVMILAPHLLPYLRVVPTYVDIPELGAVRGVVYPEARVFRGIPFGVAQRFEVPEAAASWKPETLSAEENGPTCMRPTGVRPDGISEDCLNLNVYTPTKWALSSELNPVVVWFHGGGYTLGAGSDTAPEDASELVWNHKVVVVTSNYRLGVFGFSGSAHLRSSKDNSTGNFGIQDQRLALDWVRRYIRNFGGDPQRVTVMGWSAGAASISVHLTAPKSRKLFQRAIMLSGGFTDWAALPMSAAEYAFGNVAECLGCEKSDRACLLSKSSEEMVKCEQGQWYGPVVDGVDLPISPLDAIEKGDDSVDYSIPIVIGNALDDKLVDIGRHANASKLRSYLRTEVLGAYGEDTVEKALQLYPLSIFSDYATEYFPSDWSPAYWVARTMGGDRDFTCVSRKTAKRWYQKGGEAYWYNWMQPQLFPKGRMRQLRQSSDANDAKASSGSCYPCPGAGHGADLAFLFENPSKVDVDGRIVEGSILTDTLQSLYVNFMWSTNSSRPDVGHTEAGTSLLDVKLPDWHQFQTSSGNAMRFAAGASGEVHHYREAECEFWDAHPKVPR